MTSTDTILNRIPVQQEAPLARGGLTFRGLAHPRKVRLICQDHAGAIEVWWVPGPGWAEFGGVETHSPRPVDPGDEAADGCDVLPGPCFPSGESLEFSHRFAPLIAADDVEALMTLMAD